MVFAGITLASCIDKPIYPSEPVIEYKDFIRYGSDPSNPDSVDLVISFTDNEGDIGLEQADTFGIFKYGNLYMIYFYDSANTGNWVAYDYTSNPLPPFDTLKIPYRVPPVLPDGEESEPMKGLIYVKQKPFIKVHDRIMYKVYMYDKASHKSNTVDSPPIEF